VKILHTLGNMKLQTRSTWHHGAINPCQFLMLIFHISCTVVFKTRKCFRVMWDDLCFEIFNGNWCQLHQFLNCAMCIQRLALIQLLWMDSKDSIEQVAIISCSSSGQFRFLFTLLLISVAIYHNNWFNFNTMIMNWCFISLSFSRWSAVWTPEVAGSYFTF